MTEHTGETSVRSWDLGLVVAGVAVTAIALLAVDAPRPVEWVLGVPFLLLFPGYGLVSALFPEPARPFGSDLDPGRGTERPPDVAVRLGLSLVSSAVVVALVALVLGIVGAIRLVPVVVAIGGVTLVGVAVAAVRRRPLARGNSSGRGPATDDASAWQRLSPGSTLQTATMVFALGVLVVAVAFTGAAPSDGEPYTEFYLQSEDDGGNLTATNYPETFVAGEGHPLHVGLENREHEPAEYEVVTLAQVVSDDGEVVIQQRVDRFDVRLQHGENVTVERQMAPTVIGEEIRLQVLLYRGGAPSDPGAESADQQLQIWTDVVESS